MNKLQVLCRVRQKIHFLRKTTLILSCEIKLIRAKFDILYITEYHSNCHSHLFIFLLTVLNPKLILAPQKGKSQGINANKAHEKVYFNIV